VDHTVAFDFDMPDIAGNHVQAPDTEASDKIEMYETSEPRARSGLASLIKAD